jgi:hypothetical protein
MADETFAENPWSAEFWNLTRQGQYIQKYGVEVAKTKAKQAGAKFGDLKPRAHVGPFAPIPQSNFTVIVQRKGLPAPVGGGGLVGAGSSGNGAPE